MKVFLSYANSDKRWAEQLTLGLRTAGFEVWDANREVLPGDNWALAIADALGQSDAMVVLISPEALESQTVRHEIEYALGSRIFRGRLVPVVVRPTDNQPWILRELRQVEFKDSARASAAVIRILRQTSDPEPPTRRAAAH